MPFEASERAFKIFTEAYGKAWSPEETGPGMTASLADPHGDPTRVDPPDATRAAPERLPLSPL